MYKRLNLNREHLINDINNCLDEKYASHEVSDIIESIDKTRHRLYIEVDKESFSLDFQYIKDGTTTIEVNSGKPNAKIIKEVIANYIVTSGNSVIGKKVSKKSEQCVLEGIKKEDLEEIINILKKDKLIQDIEEKKNLQGTAFTLKGPQSDKVTITYYNTGKIMIQGKQLILYYELLSYLTSLLDKNDITNLYNEQYDLGLEMKSQTSILSEYLPNAAKHLDFDPLNKFLIQSVYNLHLKNANVVCYDGHIVPAMKALEGFIKIVLYNDYEITIPKNSLPKFEEGEYEGVYYLNSDDSKLIGDLEIVKYINQCYNYYRNNRHSVVHYDSPNALLKFGEATKIVSTEKESNDIIREVLKKIDMYYLIKK